MGVHDRLGRAGGPRRVEPEGHRVEPDRLRGKRPGPRATQQRVGTRDQPLEPASGRIRVCDQYLGAAVREDGTQVPGREPRIEGNRDGADLDRGEERRREADAVRQEQGDPLLGLDAARAERVPRAVDEGAQLGIGDTPGRCDQRRLIAQALGDRLIDEGSGGIVHRQAEPAGGGPIGSAMRSRIPWSLCRPSA